MIGSARGRKPLVVDTMKAGNELSFGLVSLRTSKCGREVGVIEPMVDMASKDECEICDEVKMDRKLVGKGDLMVLVVLLRLCC